MRPQAKCHPDSEHAAFGLCKKCYSAQRYANSPESHKQRSTSNAAKRRLLNPEVDREYGRKWRAANPDKTRAAALLYNYGITPEQFAEMRDLQEGRCKICNDTPTTRALSVDHCHTTKKVRGLLCHKCNAAIGLLKHEVSVLESAIVYLKGD